MSPSPSRTPRARSTSINFFAGHEFSRLEPWDVPVSCHIDQHTATDDAVAVVVDGVDVRFAGGDGTDRFALLSLPR